MKNAIMMDFFTEINFLEVAIFISLEKLCVSFDLQKVFLWSVM